MKSIFTNKIIFLMVIINCPICMVSSQNVFAVIDSVNESIGNKHASFSYNLMVENVIDTNIILLDKGILKVNNTNGKYDDFLYISHQQNDTICYVKDTLLRIKSGEIRKDYNQDALHVRVGTTKMFFRCYSLSFRNETKLINPARWDSLNIDSIDSKFYYLSLQDTMCEDDVLQKKTIRVMINKNDYTIKRYNYLYESKNDKLNNVFTFSDWTFSSKIDQDVNIIFEKFRQQSNSPEYLSKFPSRKMRLEHNKSLSLDEMTLIDINDINHRLGDFNVRYLILYFWFKGCYHCRHVGPVIEKFSNKNMRKDITYLGVDTMSKNKKSLSESIEDKRYDFPNYRYNETSSDLTVNGAPMVIIYDNVKNEILEQLLGGSPDYEMNFSKLINELPKGNQ